MIAIFKKELHSFFNAPVGYLIILLFLTMNGLFLWVFKQEYNVFDTGFADLGNFFSLVPWVFLFLAPAITMRSISEERKLGTMEVLMIAPISDIQLVLGKFMGILFVGIIALIPTILYVFAISALGMVPRNYDLGVVLGSYAGVFFLLALFCSIGLYTSSLSGNQIFAFILGAALCFLVFYGPEAIATLAVEGNVQFRIKRLGALAHYQDISKGVLDTRDIIYFLSLTVLFIVLSMGNLAKKENRG